MMMSNDIGIDLGTASILVYIKGKGVVLKEPSVVAIDRDTNKIKAIGEEARLMIGRTPGNIVAVRPLRQGVISDYTVTEKMLKYFINKAVGKKTLRKPRISVCIPSGATEVEKKAVEDVSGGRQRSSDYRRAGCGCHRRRHRYRQGLRKHDRRYRRRYFRYRRDFPGRYGSEYVHQGGWR